MTSKQEVLSHPKMMLIDMDENQSEDCDENEHEKEALQKQNYIVFPEQAKCQRIQINSLESFKHATQQNLSSQRSPKIHSITPNKKRADLKVKVSNNLSNNLSQSEIESISQIKSINQSSMDLIGKKKKSLRKDQFQIEMEGNEEERSDSPQKLKKKVNRLQEKQRFNLLCPPEELWQKSYAFMDKLYSSIGQQKNFKQSLMFVREFLHSPLPMIQSSYMRYVFEIHLYKHTFTFNTYYEFYMCNSYGDMIHLIRSEKDSFSVSSSHLLYATNPQNSEEKIFAAKLKYNTVKSEYNLYDVDEKEKPKEQRRFLGTGFYEKPIGDQRSIQFYVPKVEFMNNDFIKSETNKNLLSFYNETQNSVYKKVEMLRTIPIPKDNEAKVRQEFELKNEGRRILMVDEEGQEKFYMGKKQNQRYLILASGGLTPLQVFALAIVNMDH